jgi:hypothetical protein
LVANRHRDRKNAESGWRWRPRPQTSGVAPTPVRDAEGYDLKPNPLTARTPAGLVAALREYRAWAGSPPLRKMAATAREKVAYTTMWSALNGAELPKFHVVMAIVQGCGGSQEDLRAFATAHRRINLGKLD